VVRLQHRRFSFLPNLSNNSGGGTLTSPQLPVHARSSSYLQNRVAASGASGRRRRHPLQRRQKRADQGSARTFQCASDSDPGPHRSRRSHRGGIDRRILRCLQYRMDAFRASTLRVQLGNLDCELKRYRTEPAAPAARFCDGRVRPHGDAARLASSPGLLRYDEVAAATSTTR